MVPALDLSSTRLTDHSILPALHRIETSDLQELKLDNNELSYFGEVVRFPEALALQAISLAYNDFISGTSGIQLLLKRDAVRSVDLSMIDVPDYERAALFDVLGNKSSYEQLNLAAIVLTDTELTSMLSQWLMNDASIIVLDLSDNSELTNQSLSQMIADASALHIQKLSIPRTDLSEMINASA